MSGRQPTVWLAGRHHDEDGEWCCIVHVYSTETAARAWLESERERVISELATDDLTNGTNLADQNRNYTLATQGWRMAYVSDPEGYWYVYDYIEEREVTE